MLNNLKLIKGIGPIIEQHLHEAGIHTFADLAALSAEDIASIIPGMSVRQITKQGWIPQAHKLVLDETKSQPRQKKPKISASRQHYENFTFEFLLDEKNKTRRLRVVHVQSGDVDTWAKWDAERLLDFLTRHTGSRLAYATSAIRNAMKAKPTSSPSVFTEPRKPFAEATLIPSMSVFKENSDSPSSLAAESTPQIPTSVNNMAVNTANQQRSSPRVITSLINKIRLLEWNLLVWNTDQSLSNPLPDQAFDVRLTLDLNSAALPDGSNLESSGTLYAKKISGGQRQMLSEAHGVVPYAKIINLTIGNARLSAGYYRLEALVTLKPLAGETRPQPALIAFLEVGLLRVY